MKSVYNFVVKPKGERYNNTKKTRWWRVNP